MNDSQVSQEWKTLVPTVKRFLLTRATAEFLNRIKEEYRERQWTARDVNWLAKGIIGQITERVVRLQTTFYALQTLYAYHYFILVGF